MRKSSKRDKISTRHMRAAVALAEEGSFSRAAIKAHTGQSALTKQISFLERYFGFSLFARLSRQVVTTAEGEAFVEQARISLQYQDRAIEMARVAHQGVEHVLRIGKSPYTDPYFLSILYSLRLPSFPKLRVDTTTKLAPELAQEVTAGFLDMALLTGVPMTARLTSITVGNQPFYVAMLEDDPLARQFEIQCVDLERNSCILFERHVNPYLYDTLIRVAKPASRSGQSLHHMMTAEEGSNLIRQGFGVAVLTQAGAWRISKNGITMRPLNCEVRLETRFTCRSDTSSPLVSAYLRAFVTRSGKLGEGSHLPSPIG